MKEEAEALGADAIVGVRLTTSMLMSGASEIVPFGSLGDRGLRDRGATGGLGEAFRISRFSLCSPGDPP